MNRDHVFNGLKLIKSTMGTEDILLYIRFLKDKMEMSAQSNSNYAKVTIEGYNDIEEILKISMYEFSKIIYVMKSEIEFKLIEDVLEIRSNKSTMSIPVIINSEPKSIEIEFKDPIILDSVEVLKSFEPISMFCQKDSIYEAKKGVFFIENYTLVADPTKIVFFEDNPFKKNFYSLAQLVSPIQAINGKFECSMSKDFIKIQNNEFEAILSIKTDFYPPINPKLFPELKSDMEFSISISDSVMLNKSLQLFKSKDVKEAQISGKIGQGVIISCSNEIRDFKFEISDDSKQNFLLSFPSDLLTTALSATFVSSATQNINDDLVLGITTTGKTPVFMVSTGRLKQLIATKNI